MRKFVQKNSKKIYWLSLLATVLLSYGFLLTQVSVGIDDEAYGNYYGGDSLAAQGRVGYILALINILRWRRKERGGLWGVARGAGETGRGKTRSVCGGAGVCLIKISQAPRRAPLSDSVLSL